MSNFFNCFRLSFEGFGCFELFSEMAWIGLKNNLVDFAFKAGKTFRNFLDQNLLKETQLRAEG